MGEKRTVELELATTGADLQGRPAKAPIGIRGGALTVGEEEGGIGGEHLLINIGPQHPATIPSQYAPPIPTV